MVKLDELLSLKLFRKFTEADVQHGYKFYLSQ